MQGQTQQPHPHQRQQQTQNTPQTCSQNITLTTLPILLCSYKAFLTHIYLIQLCSYKGACRARTYSPFPNRGCNKHKAHLRFADTTLLEQNFAHTTLMMQGLFAGPAPAAPSPTEAATNTKHTSDLLRRFKELTVKEPTDPAALDQPEIDLRVSHWLLVFRQKDCIVRHDNERKI